LTKKSNTIPIKVESIDEAEKIIYEKVKQGTNTRDIVKIEFNISGISKKFNPYQIKKIKEKFEIPKQDNKNPDKSILFELFEKGVCEIDAVIQTKFDPRFVNQVWMEYLEMKGLVTIPKDIQEKLFGLGNKVFSPCDTYDKVLGAFGDAIDLMKELDRFYIPCRVCDIPIILSENMIKQTTQWMQDKWVCSKICRQEEEQG